MKRVNMKRIMSFLLACSMLIACFTGCGKKTNPADGTTSAPKSTEASTEKTDGTEANTEANTEAPTDPIPADPVTITVGVSSLGNGWPEKVEDDFVRQAIFDATNVWVDVINIDEYYTSLNVQLTGGTAPDFFYASFQKMKEYASQGLIQPFTDYKDDIKPVFDYIGEQYDNFTLYADDVMYAIPKAHAINDLYYGFYMRQDLLDKYNLEVPTTVDELYDFLVKAVADNASGLDTTIGLAGKDMHSYDLIAGTYGTQLGNYIIIEDGKVTNTLLSPNMKDALTAVKKFVDAGLISPNTFNKGSGTLEMRQGQAVCGVTQWSSLMKAAYIKVLTEVNPDGKWAYVQPLKPNVDGVEPFIGTNDYNFNSDNKLVINATTSEEKIQAMVRVVNWLASDEGKMTSWIGIEGTHWNYDANGNAVMIDGQAEKVNYIHTYQFIGRNDPEYLNVKFPEADEVNKYDNALPRLTVYNNTVDIPADFYLDDLKSYVESQMLAFVKGERPIDDYDNFVQELYASYDFQRYMDIATEQLTEMGLVK